MTIQSYEEVCAERDAAKARAQQMESIADELTIENENLTDFAKHLGLKNDSAISEINSLREQARELAEALTDIRNGLLGLKKSCGHDFTCVCADDRSRAALAKFNGGK